jgi:hypothetical protein
MKLPHGLTINERKSKVLLSEIKEGTSLPILWTLKDEELL